MVEIPARKGKATHLRRGQIVKVINTAGQQVVDTWAFNSADVREFMSMEHSRVAIGHILPAVGDALVTNRQAADPDPGRRHLGRHPRHPVRRLRSLALRASRLRGPSRKLHRQSRRRSRRARAGTAGDAGPAQFVHEHPGSRRQPGRGAAAGQHPEEPRLAARRDALCRRFLRLPAGHAAGQRARDAADPRPFRDPGITAASAPEGASG